MARPRRLPTFTRCFWINSMTSGTRISRENTDIYKSFWNLDSYSRPQTPRPEEACRDTLVTLLRPARCA